MNTKYTKEDLVKLEELTNEINELLNTKFNCCMVSIKQLIRPSPLKINVYERLT
jgi:hypothetical protein